ncbi:MAG: DUF6635 family protein [bacterium]
MTNLPPIDKSSDASAIESAITEATHIYFQRCRDRVPAFIERHFHYPGAWRTNRVALGLDIFRAPLNLLWAPVYALASILKFCCRKLKLQRASGLLDSIPSGLTTRVQQHTAELVYDDLLQCGDGMAALEDTICRELQSVYRELSIQDRPAEKNQDAEFARHLEPIVEQVLEQYAVTRTASADVTNSLSCTVLGALAFQKFTPGGIGIGFILAAVWAKHEASRNFVFGKTLGNVYYGIFPPEASVPVTLTSVALVMVFLAVIASFAGLIFDPIQARLGLHRRRLIKMLDDMERDFIARTTGSFRPKDQFVARILDTFDMLKSNL